MVELGFRMHAERTPNPNSIKWVLGTPVAEPGVSANFMEPVDAGVSPLAARLFGVRGIRGVFFADPIEGHAQNVPSCEGWLGDGRLSH